jgi:hypothetical protein
MPAIGDKVLIYEGEYTCDDCINRKCQGCATRYTGLNKVRKVKAIIKRVESITTHFFPIHVIEKEYICMPILEFGGKASPHMIRVKQEDFEVLT